jgi:FMN-dependent NADH-azoreductase
MLPALSPFSIGVTDMTTLLRIDASSRKTGSQSRRIGDEVAAAIGAGHTIVRDLADESIPHVTEDMIGAFFGDPAALTEDQRAASALSERLLEELAAADTVLITLPMYNFGVPSALKAWFDQIVRIGRTFSFDGSGFAGLLTGKRAIVVTAYGASGYVDGAFKSADFATPYVTFALKFIGIVDVTVIPIEGINMGPEAQAAGLKAASAAAHAVFQPSMAAE